MKVYLLQSIEKVGVSGEIINVSAGYAQNFLFPRKLAVEVTVSNEEFFAQRAKKIEHRKEVIATTTSLLSEQIKGITLVIKKKMHDDERLYASVNASEIVDLLAEQNIKISKSQVVFDKAIKAAGSYPVTIKLSSKLQPQLTLKVARLVEK